MKTTLLLILLATVGTATAQPHPLRERIRRHFDADKDGKLSETERAAAAAGLKERGAEAMEKRLANPGSLLLEKFDADKDGKLSDAEKATAREAIKNRLTELRDKLKAKADTNQDGSVDESERGQLRGKAGALRERIVTRFDEDKDGKLNETERAKAREAWQQRRK